MLAKIYSYVEQWWAQRIRSGDGVYVSSIASKTRMAPTRMAPTFPASKDINVNMMPIRMGDMTSVPEFLHGYAPLLLACPAWLAPHERFTIGYLTVHESRASAAGESQRRPGLHTESPGVINSASGAGGEWRASTFPEASTVAWGGGYYESDSEEETGRSSTTCRRRMFHGGIYMASTVSNSTRVWNAKIEGVDGIVGPHGDIEHLRSLLGNGVALEAGELVWMTDRTPHESLPLKPGQYRQYFRLVTSNVSVWYAKHSTPNPLGCTPGEGVRIVYEDKFVPTNATSDLSNTRKSKSELASAHLVSKHPAARRGLGLATTSVVTRLASIVTTSMRKLMTCS